MLPLFGFSLHLGRYIGIGICGIQGLLLPHPPSTFGWIVTLKGPFATLTIEHYLACNTKKRREETNLHVFLMLPGKGAPHPIFLPQQKRHARGGFLSGMFLEGNELRPLDGDFGELKRNSVGVGIM